MTSYKLKIAAIISMTIDHTAAALGRDGLEGLLVGASGELCYCLYILMRAIGRLAFPLFAFMLAEGVKRTSSLPKYLGRLTLFAFISEPFFYLSTRTADFSLRSFFPDLMRNMLGFHLTNVFFTFAIAAAVMLVYQRLSTESRTTRLLVFVPTLLLGALLARLLGSDYGAIGVIFTVALCLASERKAQLIIVGVWAFVQYIASYALVSGSIVPTQVSRLNVLYAVCAAAAVIFLAFYNGERGKKAKWGFYIYYPVHLFVVSLFAMFVHYYAGFLW